MAESLLKFEALTARWEYATVSVDAWASTESINEALVVARDSGGRLAGFIFDADPEVPAFGDSLNFIEREFGDEVASRIRQLPLADVELTMATAGTLAQRSSEEIDIMRPSPRLQSAAVDVMISDMDFPEVKEVDLKLIELARSLEGKIVTNDFNLNKVAQLQGVEILNINELANALKPVVLPGEIMRVFILKEGKEYNQGVAYLDDGTMVVVDNARKMISKTIDVSVTSVLQTTAGKMIFGKYDERAAHREAAVGNGQQPMSATAPRPEKPEPAVNS